jgi:hypothetical protein
LARRPLLLLALFVAVALATRWLSLVVEILDTDEAAHVVGSWVLRDGGLLYRDFVDNKPPLLYAYYALAQAIMGPGLVPVRVVTVLVTVPLTALAASAVFRHDRRGLVAGTLHLLYGSAFLAHDILSANAELILLLPAAWSVVLVADERRATRPAPLLLAGALLGVATLVKHQAAFWLPAVAWAGLAATGDGTRIPRVRRALFVAVGFLLPLAVTGAAFFAQGAGPDLVYWTLRRNVGYAANPISSREALGRAAGSLVPWLAATGPLSWAFLRSRALLSNHLRGLTNLLVVLGLLPALAGLRFFPHYFVPAGFALAVGAAPAVSAWVERPRARPFRLFATATLALVIAFQAMNAVLYLGERRVYREMDPVYRAVSVRLQRDPCFPGSTLFVWGWAPAFYYYAGLAGARPASRFAVLAQAGLTGYVSGNLGTVRRRLPVDADVNPTHWEWLMEDLERSRATYVLDTAPAAIYRWDRYPLRDYPRLDAYVRERYELLDVVDGVRLFRRTGCESGDGTTTRLRPAGGRPSTGSGRAPGAP